MNCPDEDLALGMRHNFAQTLQPQITAVIEKICTQYVPGNEWLQIDKIEVDMGQLSPNVFGNDFEKIFLYKFEKELLAKLSGIPAAQRSNSVHQSMLGLLKHFLQKGVLPWWADEAEINLDDVWSDVFLNSQKQVLQFFLQQKNNTTVWKRAAFQLSEKARKELTELLKPLAAAKKLLDEMVVVLEKELGTLQHEQKAEALKVLQHFAKDSTAPVIENAPLVFEAGTSQLLVKNIGVTAILRLFAANPAALELVKKACSTILSGIQAGQSPGNEYGVETGTTAMLPDENLTADSNGANAKTATGSLLHEEHQDEADEAFTEKLLAKHAGIILLSPFLKPFFTNLQLIHTDQWVSHEAQVKAVYLLKHLADGGQQHPEYQLVLEKLLCGMPVNQPLEAAPVFTQKEMDEAEALLQSVLEHWKQLKNTSVSGLRESFFKRDGIITIKENNWLLQVERKTVDILLDSIPWGFSAVSLPWNEYIIFTEW
jgi:Contractile injection system tape measure protein